MVTLLKITPKDRIAMPKVKILQEKWIKRNRDTWNMIMFTVIANKHKIICISIN
jgi:hypothetical protein